MSWEYENRERIHRSRVSEWAVISVVMIAQSASAQPAPPSESNEPPSIGREVVVTTDKGELVGKLLRMDDTRVVIKVGGEFINLSRASVESVVLRYGEPPPIGREVVVTTDKGEFAGKLLTMNDDVVLIKLGSGELIRLGRFEVKSVVPRDAVPPSPTQRRAAIGREVVVTTEAGEIAGKLVDVDDTRVVIEKDGGERITLARASIKSVVPREAEPSPSPEPTPLARPEPPPVEPAPWTLPFRPLDPFHFWLTLGSGFAWFTSQASTQQGFPHVSPIVHFGVMPEIFDVVTLAATYDEILVSTSGGQTYEVIDQNGNEVGTTTGSSAFGVAGLAAGLRTPAFTLSEAAMDDPMGARARSRVARKQSTLAFGYVRAGNAWIVGGGSYPFLDAGAHIQFQMRRWFGLSLFVGYRHYFGASSIVGEVPIGLGLSCF